MGLEVVGWGHEAWKLGWLALPGMNDAPALILASSSPYRRLLLERLRLPFRCHAPNIDESQREGESPQTLVERLAREKALTVAQEYPDALIIGADEVAVIADRVMSKPGNRERARRQLRLASGRVARFLTCLCLFNSRAGRQQQDTVSVEVAFRTLTDAEIERYLDLDAPYQCAGSFKAEAGGITLVERISGYDDTALLGLPLISLQKMLRNEGYTIP